MNHPKHGDQHILINPHTHVFQINPPSQYQLGGFYETSLTLSKVCFLSDSGRSPVICLKHFKQINYTRLLDDETDEADLKFILVGDCNFECNSQIKSATHDHKLY